MRLALESSITSRRLCQTDTLAEQLGQDALDELNEHEIATVHYLYGNGRVQAGELAEHPGRSRTTASRILRGLESKGAVDFFGWRGRLKASAIRFALLLSRTTIWPIREAAICHIPLADDTRDASWLYPVPSGRAFSACMYSLSELVFYKIPVRCP